MKYTLLILLLFSCKAVKVNKQKTHVVNDSVSYAVKSESVVNLEKTTTGFLKKDNTESAVLQKEDDSTYSYTIPILVKVDSGSYSDFPRVQQNGVTYVVVPTTKTINKKHKETSSTTNNNIIDTGYSSFIHLNKADVASADGVKVHNEITTKEITKKTTKFNFWWLLIIPIVYFIWKYKKTISSTFKKLIKFL